MKNILLTGYYGFSNIGDEAVLEGIISQLKAVIPGVRLTVLSNSPEETAAFYRVSTVNRWKFFKVLRAMWQSDLFILGGGSLLQDVTGTKSLFFYLGQIILARLCACPVFLYAQGIGPVRKKGNLRFLRFVLKRARAITVRDEDSYSFLKQLGIKEHKLYLTCDPVLAMKEKEMSPPLPQGKKVAFALREWPGFDASVFAAFADLMIEHGFQVVLLPFNEPRDREIAEEVKQRMIHKAFIPNETLSSGAMFSAIGCMDLLIGMRLHAGIMAAATGVPFIPVVYDPKVASFARQTGQTIMVDIHGLTAETLSEAVGEMLPQLEETHNSLLAQKEHWLQLTKANAILAREYAFGMKKVSMESAFNEINQENEQG